MRVRLVVTGDLERRALGPSITRVFAATSPHLAIDVAHKLNELTTTRLLDPSNQAIRTPTPVTKMAHALVTEALHSPRGNEADMVLGVADLELANADQPGAVLAWIRRALASPKQPRSTGAAMTWKISRPTILTSCPCARREMPERPPVIGVRGVKSGTPSATSTFLSGEPAEPTATM